MEIVSRGHTFVIPCREWVADRTNANIVYVFSKRCNAQRALGDKITKICYYCFKIGARLLAIEQKIYEMVKIGYQVLDDDVFESEFDAGDSCEGDGTTEGDDIRVVREAGATHSGSRQADFGDGETDGGT